MVNLLIVESPGKIKTLKKILGAGWEILPSVGHICQLAQDGPEKLGFDMTGSTITCRYVPNGSRGKRIITTLKAATQKAERIYLAPDPDREGEAIAWHLARELKLTPERALRVTYTQITDQAVRAALAHPRRIDQALVEAQRARQVLDRLVGWRTSPLAWRVGGKSAGRVQSAALHLVCQREQAIQVFVPQDYWSVWVDYGPPEQQFRAYYRGSVAGQEVEEEQTADDDAQESQKIPESTRVLSQAEADRLVTVAQAEAHRVLEVRRQTTRKSPPPPFTTSSLQQAASAQLRLNPERTMQIAQKLYEGVDVGDGPTGLITYMRTDSITLAPEFVAAARAYLTEHDPQNLPTQTTRHRSKEHSQEAHEAIRPTHIDLVPQAIRSSLDNEQYRLYDLIWRRALASQCAPARLDKTRILTQSGPVFWEARGMTVAFAGYTRYWPNLEEVLVLPGVQERQPLILERAGHDQKQTQPPPRYTEAKLVQTLERLGIGRPSTFAPTVATLKERGYVELTGKALTATPLGLQVDQVLEQTLPELIQADFTAAMETALDEIAAAQRSWEHWLIDWNQSYLVPALLKANRNPSLLVANRLPGKQKNLGHARERCPTCQQPLTKVPSKKVRKGYFLKCVHCPQVVLFWSDFKKVWQTPSTEQAAPATATPPKTQPPATRKATPAPPPPSPEQNVPVAGPHLSAHPCPVCKELKLEVYSYRKGGQLKSMLRCSDARARTREDHCGVAYFPSRGVWWSKEFGELV